MVTPRLMRISGHVRAYTRNGPRPAPSSSRNAIYSDITMSQGPCEPRLSGRISSELFENMVVDDLLGRNLLASNIYNDII